MTPLSHYYKIAYPKLECFYLKIYCNEIDPKPQSLDSQIHLNSFFPATRILCSLVSSLRL